MRYQVEWTGSYDDEAAAIRQANDLLTRHGGRAFVADEAGKTIFSGAAGGWRATDVVSRHVDGYGGGGASRNAAIPYDETYPPVGASGGGSCRRD